MTRSPQPPTNPRERRMRITLAAVTGILAGATRALADWVIDHV
jgi:hypothetical protein